MMAHVFTDGNMKTNLCVHTYIPMNLKYDNMYMH